MWRGGPHHQLAVWMLEEEPLQQAGILSSGRHDETAGLTWECQVSG